ncbi:MAG: hypothetical protein LAT82_02030 [Nanoarchaeota archaeon]|nr:hypothetical protein [Nanoarchaeota archaeon]
MEFRFDRKTGLYIGDLERMSPAQKRELSQIINFWSKEEIVHDTKTLPHYMPRDNSKRSLPHLITLCYYDGYINPVKEMERIGNISYIEDMMPQVPLFNYYIGFIPLRSGTFGLLESIDPLRKRHVPSNVLPLVYRKIGESEI